MRDDEGNVSHVSGEPFVLAALHNTKVKLCGTPLQFYFLANHPPPPSSSRPRGARRDWDEDAAVALKESGESDARIQLRRGSSLTSV